MKDRIQDPWQRWGWGIFYPDFSDVRSMNERYDLTRAQLATGLLRAAGNTILLHAVVTVGRVASYFSEDKPK